MVVEFSFKIWLFVASILVLYGASVFEVAAGGSSVEDLVGVFSIQKTIRLGSSGGCFDSANNAIDQSSPQSNAQAGDQARVLMRFSLEPMVVMRSSSQSINLTAHIIDGQSGLSDGSKANFSAVWFRSPSGRQSAGAHFSSDNITSGSKQDGIYSIKVILPLNSEAGAWRLDNLTLMDNNGSSTVLDMYDLIRQGFPSEFLVT